jgi:hypothetical protein
MKKNVCLEIQIFVCKGKIWQCNITRIIVIRIGASRKICSSHRDTSNTVFNPFCAEIGATTFSYKIRKRLIKLVSNLGFFKEKHSSYLLIITLYGIMNRKFRTPARQLMACSPPSLMQKSSMTRYLPPGHCRLNAYQHRQHQFKHISSSSCFCSR